MHVIVPEGFDHQARASGGNVYDRRVCAGLAALGWEVTAHAAAGSWPRPSGRDSEALGRLLGRLPDGALVLVDGLMASAVPAVLEPVGERLRLVVLVHLPLGEAVPGQELVDAEAKERRALAAARCVITTSSWTRDRLVARYDLAAERVLVARPGVEPAELTCASDSGARLLCVGAVTATKGHDVLVHALAEVADLPWRCACVGSLDREPEFVAGVRRQVEAAGLSERICFPGVLGGRELEAAYTDADLLVLASRVETYGMVITEALARGIPVLVSDVGGVPEAVGRVSDGRPGLLVPVGDPTALAAALRSWLVDGQLRQRLRRAARERRSTLTGWDVTADVVGRALTSVR